jgi:hypothetical protein
VHDFHPPIAPNGLYWVAPVPDGGLIVAEGGKTLILEMKDVPVVDQPRWPAFDAAATPAKMSFKTVWKSTEEAVRYEDAAKHFRFTGTRAACQMQATVDVPSIGFWWKSDPLETSACSFAIMGDEVNGRYFDS